MVRQRIANPSWRKSRVGSSPASSVYNIIESSEMCSQKLPDYCEITQYGIKVNVKKFIKSDKFNDDMKELKKLRTQKDDEIVFNELKEYRHRAFHAESEVARLEAEIAFLKNARLTELRLFEIANESLGTYPRSRLNADGTKTERGVWQDGWNAYGIQLLQHWDQLLDWWKTLSIEQQSYFEELLHTDDDIVFFRIEKDSSPNPWILMNDVFGYACADGEALPIEDLSIVIQLWRKFKWAGLFAWAAQRRGIDPIAPLCDEKYQLAKNYLISEKKTLKGEKANESQRSEAR